MNDSQDAVPQQVPRTEPATGDARLAGHRPQAVLSRRATPRATYRSLTVRGFAPREAGNLTAYLAGLEPVERGWTIGEITRLLFIRHIVERGRLSS